MVHQPKRYRVLIADPSVVMRQTLKNMLKAKSGIREISEVSSGTDALEMVKQKDYDLILVDMDIPGMNGIEFLKKSKFYTKAKIILFSSVIENTIEIEKAVFFGAFDVMPKPQPATRENEKPLGNFKILNTIDRSLAA